MSSNPVHNLITTLSRFIDAVEKCHDAMTADERRRALDAWWAEKNWFWPRFRFPPEAIRGLADPSLSWCSKKGLPLERYAEIVETGAIFITELAKGTRAISYPEIYHNKDEAWKPWEDQMHFLLKARQVRDDLRRVAALAGDPWEPNGPRDDDASQTPMPAMENTEKTGVDLDQYQIPPCPGCGSPPAADDVDDVCPRCGAYFFHCRLIQHVPLHPTAPIIKQRLRPFWKRIPPSQVRKPKDGTGDGNNDQAGTQQNGVTGKGDTDPAKTGQGEGASIGGTADQAGAGSPEETSVKTIDTEPTDTELNDRQRLILETMLENEITSERRRKNQPHIVGLINRKHKPQTYGRDFAALAKRGYLLSREGPGGGMWVNPKRIADVARIIKGD